MESSCSFSFEDTPYVNYRILIYNLHYSTGKCPIRNLIGVVRRGFRVLRLFILGLVRNKHERYLYPIIGKNAYSIPSNTHPKKYTPLPFFTEEVRKENPQCLKS